MRVGLVFPRFKYPSGEPPLGIAYIASYLKKHTKAEVHLIDTTFVREPNKFINNIFRKNKYDIVGISAMTSMIRDAFSVAAAAKHYNPKCFVIIGGPHATVMPEHTIANKNVDAVCIGEGELGFAELVNNFKNLKRVNGIWYKNNNKIIKNPPREPIQDLDQLPFPVWELLPMEKYIAAWYQMDTISHNIRGASLIASRGCPYNCTYCQPCLNMIFGKRLRERSPKNIIDELRELKRRYNINAFGLQDDTFIAHKQWVLDFCEELKKSKLNLIWQCNVRANLVTYDLLKAMKEAGLVRIAVGIESASQRVLDEVYRKGITIPQVKETLRIAKKLKLKVHGYFMIGAPTETEAEVWKSIRFARDNDIDTATFSITTPLPMTHLYENSKHLIEKPFEEFDYYTTAVYKKGATVPTKKLYALKRIAYLNFHLAPKRLLNTISSFMTPAGFKRNFLKLKRF